MNFRGLLPIEEAATGCWRFDPMPPRVFVALPPLEPAGRIPDLDHHRAWVSRKRREAAGEPLNAAERQQLIEQLEDL